MLKRLIQRLASATESTPAPAAGPSAPVSPLWCGLRDACQDGWYRAETGELLEGFAISAEDVVLDVGCGEGVATLFAARQGASVIFTDTEQAKVDQVAQAVGQTPTRQQQGWVSDSNPLPVADGCASRVVCLEVLEHVQDPAVVMAELVRAGQPGAQYLLSVPDPVAEELQRGIAPAAYYAPPNHVRIFTREAFAQLEEDAGLVIEQRRANGFFWVINMLFYWARQRAEGHELRGAVRDQVSDGQDALAQDWAGLWQRLLERPDGLAIKRELERFMPKSQVIIARKPLSGTP
ncbi:MAG: putative S-adenosylmethionine-dependent methyltransferase [Stenotrophomonas maltophilia]|nr:MAG: putative S-adenosylmethionine-dependent methyltransferase [Stenotrophomonas maltophilia]